MDDDEFRESFGDEYPNAVTHDGVRMPLLRAERFSRHFFSAETNAGLVVSRFHDGTATMTNTQLRSEWPTWSNEERLQFCNACTWLREQDDFPDMLRMIVVNGDEHNWSSIALSVASILPQEEAYLILAECLAKVDGQSSANISQGIAATKHPSAQGTLRALLDRLWNNPRLWDDDAFINWIGYDATCCIQHLLELGQPAIEFEEKVLTLIQACLPGKSQILFAISQRILSMAGRR